MRDPSKPLNVVQIPRRFVREEWGGMETVVLETGKRLLAMGHQTEVLTANALARSNHETIEGLKITRTPYFYPYLGLSADARNQMDLRAGNLFSFDLMRQLRRMNNLDLIHLHTMGYLGSIGRREARRRRIPYVLSLHGGAFDMPTEQLDMLTAPTKGTLPWGKAIGFAMGSRKVVPDADVIICVGQPEQQAAQERFPEKKVVYLPNGVDPARFADGKGERFRDKYAIPSHATMILTVARIDPQKNQLLAVELLKKLRADTPDVHLVLIGPVTDEPYLEKLKQAAAQAGVADALCIVPGLAAGDPLLVDAYHAADVFLLPSMHEPFGIVILEAWAAGLPVLASRVGGVPFFVEDGVDGFLFEPGDAADSARAYHALMGSDAQASAERGREKVVREYTWDAISERLLALYREAIDAHPIR